MAAGTGIETVFLILGGIILIGYFSELFAKKTNIPNVLLLLALGYLLQVTGYANAADLSGIMGIFATLALIILLFEGGLSLNILDVLFKSGRVFLMAVGLTVASVLGGALVMKAFGFDWMVGAIVGALAGGIGSATTISVLRGLKVPEGINLFLTLESSITDVFSIVLTIVFTQSLLSGSINALFIGQGILGTFSVGLVFGVAAGIMGLFLFRKIEKGYYYMVVLALTLLLYALAELFGGSGAIAVLILAIILGNEGMIMRMFNRTEEKEELMMREFHSEISFIVRTFFFAFLGAIVAFNSAWNFMVAASLILVFLALRHVVSLLVTRGTEIAPYQKLITAINPRGLATAVLAIYPLAQFQAYSQQREIAGAADISRQLSALPEIAFYLIVLSIVLTAVLVPLVMNGKRKEETGHETPPAAEQPETVAEG
ncbi:MAG: cation:proton antiporter [Candidatus Diapherotrites archaeon]|uniref:Cation:proton antiporter n=1 Tax=Candidatus Iainarchaeum sp. TaxID=3101447 RepID=A0A8T3YKC5_9ARCH|nr:cation:proton antiporter [Candidatus Diapherotrites archaeon]